MVVITYTHGNEDNEIEIVNDRPENFDELAPEDLSAMLLDLACGRLSPGSASALETYADARPALAEELAYYRGVSTATADKTETSKPNELGWARLTRAIDKEEMAQRAKVESDPIQAVVSSSVSPLWRYAAVILGLLTFMQGAVLINGQARFDDDTRYVTVSDAQEKFELKLIFQPDTTENAIRNLLRKTGGEITAGPSAIGLYTIKFETQESLSAANEIYADAKEIVDQISQ
ncbi:MAG: hypothetical protein AAGH42_11955 [Pseudomonadota bacterium]